MNPGLCISTLGCVQYTLPQVIDLLGRYGISSVEIRGLCGILDNREIPAFSSDEIGNTARRLSEAGVSVACLGTSCAFHKTSGLDGVIGEGTASAKIAKALGCRYIRVFGNKMPADLPREDAVARVAHGLGRLASAIEGSGVSVLLETHGDFADLSSVSELLSAAGRGDVGLVWDVAHTERACPGSHTDFLDCFIPLIKHVHFKDWDASGKLCLPGEGVAPLQTIAVELLERGYAGKISLEWERKWHPELPPLEAALTRFINLLN